jgi:chromosome segregation ATPase
MRIDRNIPHPLSPDIEALKRRHRELADQKIAAETNLERATDQLEQLKHDAREQYGTDDLGRLRDLLEEMKRDNERKRIEYDRHLSEVEKGLDEIEQDRPGPGRS